MKVNDLIKELEKLDGQDTVVIVTIEHDGQDTAAWEPNVVGRDGWHEVSEIHLGVMISG